MPHFHRLLAPTLALLLSALPLTGCKGTANNTLSNGAKYSGAINAAGYPNGRGTATYPDGRTYSGQWHAGQWEGRGILTFPDGSKYEGQFAEGQANGHGVYTNAIGERIEGNWVNGECNGRTVHLSASGTRMESEYREGHAVASSGTKVYAEGSRQRGEWQVESGTGKGVIEWTHGQKYEGTWKVAKDDVDVPDGEGKMTYADGRVYTGQFRDGRANGKGTLTFPDGKVQSGEWENGKLVKPDKK
jgi:hypothetical protein